MLIKDKGLIGRAFSLISTMLNYVEDRLSSTSPGRLVALIALLGTLWVSIVGIKSDIHLGDEPTHYVLASTIYDTKSRPLYYQEIHNSPITKKWAGSEVLWHGLLACLWWLWGEKSKILAQLYQAGWYTLLIVITYFLAKTLYTEKRGLYSALLVATIPMVASYSIMFYLDVPLMALTVLCFLMLTRKRYFWAGVVLGLMFLMKRNAYLLAPFFCIIILYQLKEVSSLGDLKNLYKLSTLGEGYKKLAAFILPTVCINLPDLYFRSVKFHGAIFYNIAQAPTVPDTLGYPTISAPFIHPENFVIYPENLIKYPGIVIYICFGLYLLRNQYSIKDFPMVLSSLGYIFAFPMAAFLVYLKDQTLDVAIANINNILNTSLSFRYIGPVFPLVAILASGGFVSLENKSWRKALIYFCVLQVLISTLSVYNSRCLPPSVKEAYKFIRINTPQNSNILTTRTDIVIHAGRKVMWSSDGTMRHLPYLFWEAKDNEILEIFKAYGITHLYISKDDVWDDSNIKNIGKYPRSFVNRLPSFSFLKCIFDNKVATIWAVEPAYVSIERMKDNVVQ